MEAVTQEIIGFLMADKDVEIDIAMDMFYDSTLYEKLQDEGTGLYLEGSAYVYELFRDQLSEIHSP